MAETEDREQLLRDYKAGATKAELSEKYGLDPRVVAGRIRWAGARGLLSEQETTPETETDQALEEYPEIQPWQIPGVDIIEEIEQKVHSENEQNSLVIKTKTPEQIRILVGSLQDKHILRQCQAQAERRIKEHEAKIGRKDAGFRIAMTQWKQKERYRRLGITANDIRQMRGILPVNKEESLG